MSTATKTKSMKGVRYTDVQKQEVVDFTKAYNADNGRGGQSKAAEKYNISQLTISTWLKAAGAPAPTKKAPKAPKTPKAAKSPKAAKAPKAPKAVKAPKAGRKSRYNDEQKKEVTDFVVAYNAANGRGGPSTASKKFGVSPLTVGAWLKAAGVTGTTKSGRSGAKKGGRRAAPASAVNGTRSSQSTGGYGSRLDSLVALGKQIDKSEAELNQLKAKFNSLVTTL